MEIRARTQRGLLVFEQAARVRLKVICAWHGSAVYADGNYWESAIQGFFDLQANRIILFAEATHSSAAGEVNPSWADNDENHVRITKSLSRRRGPMKAGITSVVFFVQENDAK